MHSVYRAVYIPSTSGARWTDGAKAQRDACRVGQPVRPFAVICSGAPEVDRQRPARAVRAVTRPAHQGERNKRLGADSRTRVGRLPPMHARDVPATFRHVDHVVELENVSRRYGDRGTAVTALDAVSVSIAAGTLGAVRGATGSGKSTLLHCAAGLDRATSGRIRLAGRDITHLREAALTRLRRDRVGFVFQAYNLLSELTVEQNVLLPHRLGGPRPRNVNAVLESVGLNGLARRPVASRASIEST